MDKLKTCCFIGHRHISMDEEKLMEKTSVLIMRAINQGYTYFVSGGEIGFDMIASEMICFFKDLPLLKNIKLEIAVPYKEHDIKYSNVQKHRYKFISNYADKIRQSRLPRHRSCYILRNKYMVSKSALVIAYYEQDKTGRTKNTLDYAVKSDKEIWYV